MIEAIRKELEQYVLKNCGFWVGTQYFQFDQMHFVGFLRVDRDASGVKNLSWFSCKNIAF